MIDTNHWLAHHPLVLSSCIFTLGAFLGSLLIYLIIALFEGKAVEEEEEEEEEVIDSEEDVIESDEE